MKRIRLTRRPGQPGTKKLQQRYGDDLICVRYRYDEERGERIKTVEIAVDNGAFDGARVTTRRRCGSGSPRMRIFCVAPFFSRADVGKRAVICGPCGCGMLRPSD